MNSEKNIDGDVLIVKETEQIDMFQVVNQMYDDPEEHTYVVSTDSDVTHVHFCNCPHHQYRDETCKHMRAVQSALNMGDFETVEPLGNETEATTTLISGFKQLQEMGVVTQRPTFSTAREIESELEWRRGDHAQLYQDDEYQAVQYMQKMVSQHGHLLA